MRRPWPDMEALLLRLIVQRFPATFPPGNYGTMAGLNLQERLSADTGFTRVAKITGSNDDVTDFSIMDVEVFGLTRAFAYSASEGIRGMLLDYPHRIGEVMIDRVVTERAPVQSPTVDDNIKLFAATYRFSARR